VTPGQVNRAPYEKISLRRKAAAKSSNTDQTAVPKGT
jgi:hypothetical protein